MERDAECGACGTAARGGEPCPGCGRLTPFPPGAEHWTVLGLPRRLALERAEIEARAHALNRRFHPDYFRLRPPEEQAASLEAAATVNAAYRMLRDPLLRVEYLLEQEGLGLGAAGSGRPPADLFEELLEIQEARQELAAGTPDEVPALRERLRAVRVDLDGRRARTEAELLELFPRWDAAPAGGRRALLETMRELLARRAYIRTVLRDLDATLDGGEGRTD